MRAIDPRIQLGLIVGGAVIYVLWLFKSPPGGP
jgi:hypothetical protein